MKLINKTKVSDQALVAVLSDAAQSLNKRLRTTNVVVKVTYNKFSQRTNGVAYRCYEVRWDKRWRTTDKGAFKISIPMIHPSYCSIESIKHFFDTARHEWGHIADFQHNELLDFDKPINGRRKAHDYRPEEKRVYEYIEQAERKGITKESFADSILNLAIEVELKYFKS